MVGEGIMAASQRLSRCFLPIGLFLAIPLIGGSVFSVLNALNTAGHAKMVHDAQVSLVCAQTALKTKPIGSKYSDLPPGHLADDERVDLTKLGCSEWNWTPTVRDVRKAQPPGEFSYAARFLASLGLNLAITLIATLQGVAITIIVIMLGRELINRDW
jgi:hypothetical protein